MVRQVLSCMETVRKIPPKFPSSEPLDTNVVKHGVDQEEVSAIINNAESSLSTSNGELLNENASDVHVEHPPSFAAKDIEVFIEDHLTDGDQDTESQTADVPSKTEQEKSQHVVADSHVNSEAKLKEDDVKIETPVNQKKLQEQNAGTPPKMVQDQLDEAQGLLKTTNSTGQSKEARLARVCAGLSSRLQEYKSENAQLEELLIAEAREQSKSYETRIKQLQQDLSVSKSEVTRIESNMVEALAAKNSEIEALVNSMDALKKQAALSEGNLASLQANMESIMRNRELTDDAGRALREELSSAERREEEERAAHNATKMAAMEREVELENRAVEASTALARIQRVADERTAKAAELEQKVALLEVEYTSLKQELQDMEARAHRGQRRPQKKQIKWFRRKWSVHAKAEVQKVRVKMAAMKRDAEHYSRQEHMELEKRYRELTDLLYYKQTQLETMASEKAAAEFQLEKEIKRLQEAQSRECSQTSPLGDFRPPAAAVYSRLWSPLAAAEKTYSYPPFPGSSANVRPFRVTLDLVVRRFYFRVSKTLVLLCNLHALGPNRVEVERSRVPRRASSSWEEDIEIKALEPLPVHHRHVAAASIQLQKAVKLLDSGAVRATRFLWRYPKARIILLCYLVLVHLFLMYLLHRLQEQADILAANEVAKSMGLANS
ncbi:Golgin candidate 1 [Hibiscus syriacus]|uniref:Golgin candidate 1 n=1 Tax=Hibiscus syriacus TaxID=106335 RepID=A0A6A3A251_HIBSY|nr:Golgin candidate 1 [Hibiscus syriacus]